MTRGKIISIAVGVLVIVAVGVLVRGCNRAPKYADEVPPSDFQNFEVKNLLAGKPVAELRTMLENSQRLEVRKNVATALGYKKDDPAATALLVELVTGENKDDAINGILALAYSGAPEAKEHIQAFAKSEDPEMRAAAAYAIGEYGDSTLYPLLDALMDDPSRLVRGIASGIRLQIDEGRSVVPFAESAK